MDQNTQQQTLSLEEIWDKIASAIGATDQPDERQMKIIDKATDVLLEKIFLNNIEKLSEEDQKIYSNLLENGAEPEEIAKFLNEKIPNYNAFTRQAVDAFISEMKAAATG